MQMLINRTKNWPLSLLALIVLGAIILGSVAGAGDTPVDIVFVQVGDETTKQALKAHKDLKLRHEFPGGFSAEIKRNSRKNIEDMTGVLLLDVPKHQLSVPSDQTPYGMEQIYDDTEISVTSGGAGITIGHLDTGVKKDHPDLKNRIVGCKDATRGFRNKCDDRNGHGTHTAGTAVADGGDGSGIYGVAPQADLYVIKVCGNFCFTDDIAAAIDYLGSNTDTKIITMSLGGDTESFLIRGAITRNPHILVVASAGNTGPGAGTIGYPAANPSVVAVAAVDASETVVTFSSRGVNDGDDDVITTGEIELAAPGYGIESTWKDKGYAFLSGTSMAAPHVAGLAAREWQGTPELTRAYLRTLAEDVVQANGGGAAVGYDIASGYGLAHITPAGPLSSPPIPPLLTSITVAPAISSIQTGQSQQFTATGGYDDGSTQDLTNAVIWGSSDGAIASIDPTGLATGVSAGTSFMTASQGGVTSAPATLDVTAAPTLVSIVVSPGSASIEVGATQQFSATGSFSDGSSSDITATSSWSSSNKAVALVSAGNATGVSVGDTLIIASQDGISGNAATLGVTDAAGDTVTIIKAKYDSRKGKLDIEATSSAGANVTLTAEAFDSGGASLGNAVLKYDAKKGKHKGKITGLIQKPFRLVVTSSGGGSASVEGDGIAAK